MVPDDSLTQPQSLFEDNIISHCIYLTYSGTLDFSAWALTNSVSWLVGAKESVESWVCIPIFVTGHILQRWVVTYKLAMAVYWVLSNDYSADRLQVFLPTYTGHFRRVYNMDLQPAARGHICKLCICYKNLTII
jgi:hypothetical protein